MNKAQRCVSPAAMGSTVTRWGRSLAARALQVDTAGVRPRVLSARGRALKVDGAMQERKRPSARAHAGMGTVPKAPSSRWSTMMLWRLIHAQDHAPLGSSARAWQEAMPSATTASQAITHQTKVVLPASIVPRADSILSPSAERALHAQRVSSPIGTGRGAMIRPRHLHKSQLSLRRL
jgi:hypothetical protein